MIIGYHHMLIDYTKPLMTLINSPCLLTHSSSLLLDSTLINSPCLLTYVAYLSY